MFDYLILAQEAGFIDKMEPYVKHFLINLVTAAVIFFIGKKVAQALTFGAVKMMEAAKVDDTLIKFLKALINIGLMVIVIIASLGALGINTTSFAAILAAAGLAVGMALKDTLGNFASGVMIILFKPYTVGDFVEIAGTTGVVKEIHIFNTVMKTGDNIIMYIPNSSVTSGKICNYSAEDTRRIDLTIGCGYDDDIKAVKDYLNEVLKEHEKVARDPEPTVAVGELADSSVNFVVRAWVQSADYWPVRWDLIEKIKVGFDEKGFSIPYPQSDVHMHEEK